MTTATTEESEKKNPPFTQVYDEGWEYLSIVAGLNPLAARIFMFLARHAGRDNVVVCPSTVLEEEFDKSRTTIWRAVSVLEENKCLTAIKVGTARAFCFNEHLVWKSWATNKKYSLFNSKTLAAKSDNPHVTKRFNQMLAQKELFSNEEFDVETGEVLAQAAL